VTSASLFQNEAADFRDKSVSLTRYKGQGKEQTDVWIYGTPKGALVVLHSRLTDLL
jgi:hypothetical protein